MFPQKLKDLLEGVGYKCLQGDDQVLVNDVVYDSRRVRPGCVFVCLIGSAVDSHQYAAQQAAGAGKRNAGAGGGHPQGDGLYVGCAVRPSRR